MVFPNFFITFVRHSFHTSHSLHIPSRERRHRLHHPATRRHTPLTAHALPHALRTRGSLARCTSQKAMLTRHTHATHPRPPRSHPSQRATHTHHTHATHPRPHSTHALRATTPSQGLCHTRAPRAKCCNAFPCSPSFLRRKREPHNNQNITYYNITCNVYPNRSKDYTKKRGNLFLYRLNLLSLHDES